MNGINDKSLNFVLEQAGFADFQIEKEFASKRNKVYLLRTQRKQYKKLTDNSFDQELNLLEELGLFETGHDCSGECSSCHENEGCMEQRELAVWKQYEQGDTTYELAMIKLLRMYNVNVPLVLAADDKGILFAYVEGINLCDLFNQAELNNDFASEIILTLARWFKSYYQATGGKSRGDINLRNFIYNEKNGKLYGLDFENTNFRSPAYDIGDLLAYLISYEPAFSPWKQQWIKIVAATFIMELDLKADAVKMQYQTALKELELRRNIKVPEQIFLILEEI